MVERKSNRNIWPHLKLKKKQRSFRERAGREKAESISYKKGKQMEYIHFRIYPEHFLHKG